MNNNELMHYGVLGMKWHIHRAAKRGVDYSYKSMRTKHQERKLNKINKKIAKVESGKGNKNKLDSLREKQYKTGVKVQARKQWDASREAYARRTSTGAAIARRLLLVGANNYERFRSKGDSIGKAYLKTVISNGTLGGVRTKIYSGINNTSKREYAIYERDAANGNKYAKRFTGKG